MCLYVSLGCVKIFRLWATTRQDISSLGRGVVCLCSLGCQDVSFLSNNLSVCFVFRGGAVFVLFLYVSLGCHNLSRCFVFRPGDCACVCVFVLFLCEPWLSIWATTCQDVSSSGRGLCVCVCVVSM